MFIDSQAHWRHSASGHLEALDVAGFTMALQYRQRTVDAEDFETLLAMWNMERYVVNERVNARIEAMNKG